MTPGQKALADGFAVTIATHGQSWTRTADTVVIVGVASQVVSKEPHMVQSQNQETAIIVADASLSPPIPVAQVMPTQRLKKGDELTKGSRKYRVVSADLQESNGLWLVVLSPTF
jgi:hypothetical protein